MVETKVQCRCLMFYLSRHPIESDPNPDHVICDPALDAEFVAVAAESGMGGAAGLDAAGFVLAALCL